MDDILSRQRSPLDKLGVGYAIESSRKNDANPNASKDKNMEKLQNYANLPSSKRSKERIQHYIVRSLAPRRNVNVAGSNKYHQRTSRKNSFRDA